MPVVTALTAVAAEIAAQVVRSRVQRLGEGAFDGLLGRLKPDKVEACLTAAIKAMAHAIPGLRELREYPSLKAFFVEPSTIELLDPLLRCDLEQFQQDKLCMALMLSSAAPEDMSKRELLAACAAFDDAYRTGLSADRSLAAKLAAYQRSSQVHEARRASALLEQVVRILDPGCPGTAEEQQQALEGYLETLLQETDHVTIQGIGSKPGAGQEALFYPIEQLYTPLKSARTPGRAERATLLDEESRGAGLGREAMAEHVELKELLAAHDRLLLVGDPGAGKTTFLRLIACVLARDLLEGCPERQPSGREVHLGLAGDRPAPVPVFIRLADLASEPKELVPNHRCLLSYLNRRHGQQLGLMLADMLDHGRVALLLDGLDEVADREQRGCILAAVRGLLQHYGGGLVAITTRPFGYKAMAKLPGMATARIDDFGTPEIEEFLRRWVRLLPGQQRQGRYQELLRRAIIDDLNIRRMARNPVMLTCLCVVHWNERRLPEGKADLLAAVLRWLLGSRDQSRKARGYTSGFAEECFKALALAMCTHERGKLAAADLTWAAEQLERPFHRKGVTDVEVLRDRGRRFLEEEALDSGIVEQLGSGRIRFWHLTFQEHYAARALCVKGDQEGDGGWWPILGPKRLDRQWSEIIDHFAGSLAEAGWERLDVLVDRLLAPAREGDLVETAKAVGVVGRVLRVLQVYEYEPPPELGWAEARQRAMAVFTLEGAAQVPVAQRIAAAEALGQAGDPRLTSCIDNLLPVLPIPGLRMGRFPVTVEAYRRFVEDGGYRRPDCWDEVGWATRQDKGWTEPEEWDKQTLTPNRPVTGVSWYEARAYCRWLAALSGMAIGLPTSREWGKAARPRGGGPYPWGVEEPNADRANFEGNVGAPTPIGVYPAGAGPHGHAELAGNVWEWCSTALVRQAGHGFVENEEACHLGDKASRVLRGGSWGSDAWDLRCAFRAWVLRSASRNKGRPGGRDAAVGFRLVCRSQASMSIEPRSLTLDPKGGNSR